MSERPNSALRRVVIAAIAAVAIAVVVYVLVGPTGSRSSRGAPDPVSSTAVDVAAADQPRTDAAAAAGAPNDDEAPTLAAAIARARPLMVDNPEGSSGGTLLLLGWSTRHLRWRDVAVDHDETSHELVQKDVEGQRGKRLCVSGTILRMNPVRTDSAIFWNGVLMAPRGRPFAFLAVGSAGALADNSPARLCGVVTGRTDVATQAARPVLHAVMLVGMFDLPENRAIDRL